jgi:hypothetical protein
MYKELKKQQEIQRKRWKDRNDIMPSKPQPEKVTVRFVKELGYSIQFDASLSEDVIQQRIQNRINLYGK